LRPGVAERAWNEANPSDDAPTLRQNEVPLPLTVASKMTGNRAQSGMMWDSGAPLSDDKAEILSKLNKA